MKRPLHSACLLVLAGLLALSAPVGAQEDDDPLDARLGGTTESFEAKYGEPVESDGPAILTEYNIKGYSTVFADSYEGRIESISLFSPRPKGEEWRMDKPHEGDWSVKKAHELAKRFLPRDVKLEKPEDERLWGIRTEGFSEALENEVPESIYAYVDNEYVIGQCSYALLLNEDKSGVNSIMISLLVEEPLPES